MELKKKKVIDEEMIVNEHTYDEYEEPEQNVENNLNDSSNNNEMPLNNDIESNNIPINENEYVNPTDYIPRMSLRKKVCYFLMAIIAIIGVFVGYFTYLDLTVDNNNYEINLNLTSFGVIKTPYQTQGHTLNYLVKPNHNLIPKFAIENQDIIEINKTTGFIKGKKLGKTKVDVLDIKDEKTVKNDFTVYVVDHKVELKDFTINTKDITLKPKSFEIINITPIPSNSTEVVFTYKSSDENIVKVNDFGIIESIKPGKATITIKHDKLEKNIEIIVEENDSKK